ncbi:MAG TPA: carboxylating nicotinate-nucleotide diphosphorylase [Gemmatimonadales bacterium]|nr:carboxylating nicotinate-nucleotide diphosphorylase [Gemmatimonadales bacterium]
MTPRREIERIAAAALAEDGGTDITTAVTVPPGTTAEGLIEYRDGGVLAGTVFADAVALACRCTIKWQDVEGSTAAAGMAVGLVRGELAAILRAERPMLNLLQRACGIASATRAYVDAVRGTSCRILHTRKTAPGLRALDVAAVIAGGGHRHRVDLAHEVMVKDNHWQALGSEGLGPALAEARKRGVTALYVEVESVEQLKLACAAGATRLLVDNQRPETVRDWGRRARALSPGIEIEPTGGITLTNVRAYAEAGADYISIGALTHSVQAADIALEVRVQQEKLAADERR